MSAVLSIPTALSHHTNGVQELSVNGKNLKLLLAATKLSACDGRAHIL